MNKAAEARKIMRKWKIARTEHLEALIRDKFGMSDSAFRQLLCRLRADRHIFTSYLVDQTIHFDRSAFKRWQFLEALPDTEHEKFISKSGIEHNLQMFDLANSIESLWPSFEVIPNVLSEKSQSTFGVSDHREKHSPDIILRSRDANESGSIFVEVERSLKERSRYQKKWMAYEGDPTISICIYWISDAAILNRLISDAETFFMGGLGVGDFKLGFVDHREFKLHQSSSSITVVSTAGRSIQKVGSMIAKAVEARCSEIRLNRGVS